MNKILNLLKDYQLLKKDLAPFSSLLFTGFGGFMAGVNLETTCVCRSKHI